MSEASFFLTGALTMLGFLRYIRSHATGDMILFSLSMSAFVLARLEGPAVVLVLVVVASFDWRCLRSWKASRQSIWTLVLLGLPPFATFMFWCLEQWILLKDPLFFLHQSIPPLKGGATWLPNFIHNKMVLIPWALHWVLVLGIVIGVALAGVLVRPLSNRTRGSIGIVGAMATILFIQVWTVGFSGGGYGDPRYFSMAVPWAACAALWLASWTRETPLNPSPSRFPLAGLWNLGLIGILVLNAGTGNWTMSSGRTTGIEHECTFFQGDVARLLPFLGRGANPRSQAYCTPESDGTKPLAVAAQWLDKRLKPSDRVLTDNLTIIAPDLFTRHPIQYIVRNDRDWQKIVANPVGKFDYIITESDTRHGQPNDGSKTVTTSVDYGATLVNLRPAAWKLIYAAYGAQNIENGPKTWVQIYERSGTVVPFGINAPTGQG